jgi:hypothetical protein
MSTRNKIHAAISALSVASCGVVSADTGLYLGAGIGQVTTRDFEDTDFNQDDSGFKLFGGWRAKFFGIEGGYRDLGEPTELGEVMDAFGIDGLSVKTTGWDLYAMLIAPIGPLEFFAKAGGVYWQVEANFAGLREERDGGSAAWGLGAALRFGPVSIRAEYESFEVDVLDKLDMYSIGAAFHF